MDADTIDCDIDLGLYVHIHERLRLFGIDAWEVRGPEREQGLAAKDALERLLGVYVMEPAPQVLIRTHKDKKGKYGRFLAEVYTLDPETGQAAVHVNRWLVEQGHAEWANY